MYRRSYYDNSDDSSDEDEYEDEDGSDEDGSDEDEDEMMVIFIGNPGVGKSTILNGIVGTHAVFKSGVSIGEGKTKLLQVHKQNGVTLLDTPGLSDVNLRKRAAKEIETALRSGGQFKIFFVITLEAGRIRPDDKATIKIVLNASPQIGSNYNIIVNKLNSNTISKIHKDPQVKRLVMNSLNEGLTGTESVFFNKFYSELEDAEDVVFPLSDELTEFLNESVYIKIDAEKVQDMSVNQYEEMNATLERMMIQLDNERRRMEQQMRERERAIRRMEQEHRLRQAAAYRPAAVYHEEDSGCLVM